MAPGGEDPVRGGETPTRRSGRPTDWEPNRRRIHARWRAPVSGPGRGQSVGIFSQTPAPRREPRIVRLLKADMGRVPARPAAHHRPGHSARSSNAAGGNSPVSDETGGALITVPPGPQAVTGVPSPVGRFPSSQWSHSSQWSTHEWRRPAPATPRRGWRSSLSLRPRRELPRSGERAR